MRGRQPSWRPAASGGPRVSLTLPATGGDMAPERTSKDGAVLRSNARIHAARILNKTLDARIEVDILSDERPNFTFVIEVKLICCRFRTSMHSSCL